MSSNQLLLVSACEGHMVPELRASHTDISPGLRVIKIVAVGHGHVLKQRRHQTVQIPIDYCHNEVLSLSALINCWTLCA